MLQRAWQPLLECSISISSKCLLVGLAVEVQRTARLDHHVAILIAPVLEMPLSRNQRQPLRLHSYGKFSGRGITVLAAAKVAVVLQCALVEFVSTIVELFAVIAERLHLIGGERLKIAQDREILVKHFHGIYAADGRSD